MSKSSGYYSYLFKVVIIGDSNTGKTCLTDRFTENKFYNTHDSTLGVDYRTRTVPVHNSLGKRDNIKLQIWDTAGQETFKSITRLYYRNMTVAIITYDITNRESFNNCKMWLNELRENGDTIATRVVLIGTKTDLEYKRKITFEEGTDFAKSNNTLFYEVSSKLNKNVKEAFTSIACHVYENMSDFEFEDYIKKGIKQGNKQLISKLSIKSSCCILM